MKRKRNPDPLTVALRRRRLDMGWTQADLAERLHVRPTRVWEVESQPFSPTLATLRRFAAALDCDIALVPRSAPPPQVTDEMAGVKPRKGRALQETVLRLTRLGMSARLIAQQLDVSLRTVQRWRTDATRRQAALDHDNVTPPDQGVAA